MQHCRAKEKMRDLMISNGRMIDPSIGRDDIADLYVIGGRVSAESPNNGCEVIDARNLVVTPGLIDIHVHLREPGQTHKETIETGSQAAAAGGFSSIVCMPNTDPPADSPSAITWISDRARARARVYGFPPAATPKSLNVHTMT